MVLLGDAVQWPSVATRCSSGQVEPLCLPVLDGPLGACTSTPDGFSTNGTESRQMLTHLLGDELEEGHDMVARPVNPANWGLCITPTAGVEVTDPHHDAAAHHQCGGREAELGAQQGPDHDVAAGFELTVHLTTIRPHR